MEKADIASAAVAERVRNYDMAHPYGSDTYEFLLTLITDDVVNRQSTVGEHVHAENIKSELSTKANGLIMYNVTVDLVNDAAEMVVPQLSMSFTFDATMISDEREVTNALAALMALGFSGYMVNPLEREQVIAMQLKAFHHKRKLIMTYVCDECGKSYKSIKWFMAHLKKTGHVDSITTQYGYWGGKYGWLLTDVKTKKTV